MEYVCTLPPTNGDFGEVSSLIIIDDVDEDEDEEGVDREREGTIDKFGI